MTLLTVTSVSRRYRSVSLVGATAWKTVLHDVSFTIGAGETVALLGRSGCGKSTLARLLVGLEKPDAGEIAFDGTPFGALGRRDWRRLRQTIQLVFQDSISAVDPRATVREIIAEPLIHLTDLDAPQREERIATLLTAVGLDPSDAGKLPVQMSGGQLQRVCIARALAPNPKLLILDEAVSNLDLMLQVQMIDLLKRLQAESGIAYLFVTHDLRLVERFCARVLIMAEGRIVEEAPIVAGLEFSHPAAIDLKRAVLPAFPQRLSHHLFSKIT